ncbi:MAG: hypothetical protein ACPGXL_08790, partial [Chitinophagales bacterium]
DWVLVELRNCNDTSILMQKAALLLNDGSIVDADSLSENNTKSPLYFHNPNNFILSGDAYFVSIRHRNHLDVLSKETIVFNTDSLYDFSRVEQVMGGDLEMVDEIEGITALYSGDIDGNNIITITDFNRYVEQSTSIGDYIQSDCNLDHMVTVADFNLFEKNVSRMSVGVLQYK